MSNPGTSQRKLRMGVAGLGRAFSLMLPTLVMDERIEIVAGADPRPEARARFEQDFSGCAYARVEDMCADPRVEVVYISTPHQYHVENVAAAAASGRHILCEKPMALSVAECLKMIEAAEKAGVALVVGHSHSFDAPVRRAREIVESGAYGDVRMMSGMDYTDFLFRPRRAEELDTSKGGGVIFNQAPHQVDNVRFIGGGMVKSVRAVTGAWDASRRTEGAYSALLTFESGAAASITYSGYAHFDSDELVEWIAESGLPKNPDAYGATRRALAGVSGEAEYALKSQVNYGGERYGGFDPAKAKPAAERFHQNFGLLVVSCDGADLRPTSKGVMIYDDRERRLDAVPVPAVPRREVIDELHAAIVDGVAPVHDGRWGLATMEVCFAILASAREGREVSMSHQVPTPRLARAGSVVT
ncbi:MAG: Gfo/Idh/MocA family oxidoreductase [Beijerinckiaceae bacterium]|nr:Gfo/Idh/MocA family oxidoreductase [Beijerinckiaceae bacterium]